VGGQRSLPSFGRKSGYNAFETIVNVVLISTYELGHQPFGLASPAAWLRARGADVTCLDLSRESLREDVIRQAGFIAFYVPMHTATRLAARLIEPIQQLNPEAHLCAYGLYAPVNEAYLRGLGVHTILGGEFEERLAQVVASLSGAALEPMQDVCGSRLQPRHTVGHSSPALAPVSGVRWTPPESSNRTAEETISLDRLNFIVPDRSGLPPLKQYAHLVLPEGGFRVAGYTEASRGCKHLCRHCPIVPVYNGAFRIVPREVVIADIRQQIAAGAEHITFGDPDFFNGPAHALAIVESLHGEFPRITYDVTIKIEHLLRHAAHLPALRDTGCLFVTSAVESVDDAVLERLDKGHTRADFLAVLERFRALDMVLQPTFVPFTPWTTLESYLDLLTIIAQQGLMENVTPIQLGIRLLIPAGSRLLELDEIRRTVGEFDPAGLLYPWKHADPCIDALAAQVQELAGAGDKLKRTRAETFERIWRAAAEAAGAGALDPAWQLPQVAASQAIPRLSEPWYCCAEPTQDQFVAIGSAAKVSSPERVLAEAADFL
jgi:radical SAM superfamily enzyme YgiQ (UPF0313 family)